MKYYIKLILILSANNLYSFICNQNCGFVQLSGKCLLKFAFFQSQKPQIKAAPIVGFLHAPNSENIKMFIKRFNSFHKSLLCQKENESDETKEGNGKAKGN
jgi:hypothetical protein